MIKRYRLRKSGDFKAVLDKRQCLLRGDSMSVFHRKNDVGHARVGLSVSSKLGNAVCRNRIKRQVRAQVHLLHFYDLAEDIVIILRKGYLDKSFEENLHSLEGAISHLRGNPQEGNSNEKTQP